jgi:hypothetical protein
MRTELDDAIGVVPPSPIDVDRLIARGRRRRATRRLGAAGAAGGVASAVLAVITLAGGDGGTSGLPVGGSTPAPAASPSVSAPPSTPVGTRTTHPPFVLPSDEPPTPPALAGQTETRLTQAAKDAVRDHAPGYPLGDSLLGPPFRFRYHYEPVGGNSAGNNWYTGSADLSGPAGRGNVAITVGRIGSIWNPSTDCGFYQQPSCQVTTGPRGETVLRFRDAHEGTTLNYVIVVRPDETAVLLRAHNQRGEGDLGGPFQPEPVLTLDQLIAIGTDPRLHA